MLTVGSVCSGLGGFDYAFERQGFTVKWQVEIDKNCRKLLKAKYPNAELHADLTKFKPKDSDAVSVIVGGTPCQNLSVAGQREGLDGDRSRIFFDMVRLCKKLRPRIIEWENVPGALSSNEGRDFARVIRAFTGLKVEIPREGWGNAGFVRTPYPGSRWNIAWRVLDAQYFGVAQRRKRLFIIGSLGNASCLEILFEPESVCGDNPPSREKREGTTAEFEGGANGSGSEYGLAKAVRCMTGGVSREDSHTLVSGAVSSKWSKGTGGPAGDECYNLVAHTLRAEHDASEDGTGRGTPIIAFDTTKITSGENRNNPQPGDPCHSLAKSAHAPAIAFHPTQDPIHSSNGTTHALSCGSKNGSSSVAIATGFNGDTTPKFGNEVATTMRAQQGGEGYGVIHKCQVRRLTPVECEKLQGFPPGYSEGFSDSVRYKMLGNAVCVPVVEWIARRIKATLNP